MDVFSQLVFACFEHVPVINQFDDLVFMDSLNLRLLSNLFVLILLVTVDVVLYPTNQQFAILNCVSHSLFFALSLGYLLVCLVQLFSQVFEVVDTLGVFYVGINYRV